MLNAIPLIGPILGSVIPFLLVLGVVVFVHEYGHYIVGRWCGIHAEAFSIGFGKELFGWNDKRGTRWRLAALPLGGYVRFLGDADASSSGVDKAAMAGMSDTQRARSFPAAALWRRAVTVAAGPAANFLLSIMIFAASAVTLGLPDDRPVIGEVTEAGAGVTELRAGDLVLTVNGVPVADFGAFIEAASAAGAAMHNLTVERGGEVIAIITPALIPPVAARVIDGAAAAAAGMQPGDVMIVAGGAPVASFADVQAAIKAAGAAPLVVTVRRGMETVDLTVTPAINPIPLEDGSIEMRPMIGVSGDALVRSGVRAPGIFEAAAFGVSRTAAVVTNTFSYLGKIIDGEADASGLGGPVRIASMSGDAAESGIGALIGMIALISTSIGLINLFPIPVLDGGHLVFYAIEAVRGRPLSDRVAEAATGVGLALVIALMAFVTWNDISGL
ncbi:MAG: regulator of sigma E protease [Paracoccaceae bacterium]|jgi:regulator of sigma E protease